MPLPKYIFHHHPITFKPDGNFNFESNVVQFVKCQILKDAIFLIDH